MKLSVSRYRTRTVSADKVAQAAEESLSPGAAATQPGSNGLFDNFDDGFGEQRFETARGTATPSDAPKRGAKGPVDIDAIKAEGLSSRQLRLARRLASRRGMNPTSDFDAVRLLRLAGIDPFQRGRLLELVHPTAELKAEAQPAVENEIPARPVPSDGVRLPTTIRPVSLPSTEQRAEQAHLSDLMQIQRDISRRRRRKSALLMARLFVFVMLPAVIAGYYFYVVATPLYSAKSEFVIQQSENVMAGGMGGLLRGSPMATQQDSIAVQGFLQSREAMLRLDEDLDFIEHFSAPSVDELQRLQPGASMEAAYKVYQNKVRISYDSTEGIIKMEVMATDPATAVQFNEALISYAEEQVDELTQRMRGDQMQGAQDSYADAEGKLVEAQRRLVDLQEGLSVLSSDIEVQLITAQIGQLETQMTTERLSLAQMLSNPTPNEARVEPIKQRIVTLQNQIDDLRAKLTEGTADAQSLAKIKGELLMAEAEVRRRELLVTQAVESMETARVEANRQTRYLSVSVHPIQPDAAAYPRAFENTLVALLIFAGIYLMLAMTVDILREQVSG
ncbi:capsule biosynthesis protein [Neogemmobacter tilapiae]|nr:capsule biosynthesis protein [Gemmobacter tilapiae]